MAGAANLQKLLMLSDPSGERFAEIIRILDKVPEFQKQLEVVAAMPDEFNKYYFDRGWIAYESMDSQLIGSALALAQNGRIDDGEKMLIDHYQPEKLKFRINFIRGVTEFQPRMRLIELAMVDYFENRYHACIPVLIMMIDGVVNDITKDFGFFSENVDVTATDSIAAHESGLMRLSKLLSKAKNKTNVDEIGLPLRNGILHGRELAYDNKMVAAKSWALLFAVRDWIVAKRKIAKQGEEKRKKTIQEAIEELKAIQETNYLIERWMARVLIVGEQIPSKGNVDDYENNTPEQATIKFILYWMKGNYGKMSEMMVRFKGAGETNKKLAGELREAFEQIDLTGYELVSVEDKAPVVTEVKTNVMLTIKNRTESKELTFRWIYRNEDSLLLTRGLQGGQWYLIDNFRLEVSLLKLE